MAVVKGVNIPDNKRIEIDLTSIYGIGKTQSVKILSEGAPHGVLTFIHF